MVFSHICRYFMSITILFCRSMICKLSSYNILHCIIFIYFQIPLKYNSSWICRLCLLSICLLQIIICTFLFPLVYFYTKTSHYSYLLIYFCYLNLIISKPCQPLQPPDKRSFIVSLTFSQINLNVIMTYALNSEGQSYLVTFLFLIFSGSIWNLLMNMKKLAEM